MLALVKAYRSEESDPEAAEAYQLAHSEKRIIDLRAKLERL